MLRAEIASGDFRLPSDPSHRLAMLAGNDISNTVQIGVGDGLQGFEGYSRRPIEDYESALRHIQHREIRVYAFHDARRG